MIADIPGLIEGAAEGAGLGHQFLRHLARTRLLLHIVDLAPFDETVDPVAEAKAIVEELRKYDEELYNKPRWLVLNKVDMLENSAEKVAEFVKAYGWKDKCFAISAISGIGCKELVYAIMEHIETVNAELRAQEEAEQARLAAEKLAYKEARLKQAE